jgi:Glyoxalase-like domain
MNGESRSSSASEGGRGGSGGLLRLRQAVLAAADLDAVAGTLRAALSLGEPFADEGVGYFGLRNAVFALGDTFLEVVSPSRDDTSVGRLIGRRGGDCGYMLMFQVPDLEAARARASEAGIREVFAIALDDIAEVHLHPADMHGAIVSLSEPAPPGSWRWGGPGWPGRTVAERSVSGAVMAVADPEAVTALWTRILGGAPPGISFVADPDEQGLVEIRIAGSASAAAVRVGSAQVTADSDRWADPG